MFILRQNRCFDTLAKKRNRVKIRLNNGRSLKVVLAVVILLFALFVFPFIGRIFSTLGKAVRTGDSDTAPIIKPSAEAPNVAVAPAKGAGAKPVEGPQKTPPPPLPLQKRLMKDKVGVAYNLDSGELRLQKGILSVRLTLPRDKLQVLLNSEIGSQDIMMSDTSDGNKQAVFVETQNVPLLKGLPVEVTIKKKVKNVVVYFLENLNEFYNFKQRGSEYRGLRSVSGAKQQAPENAVCKECTVSYGTSTIITIPKGFSSGHGFEFDDLPPNAPAQGRPILNATTLLNLTTDDLFCNAREFSDPNGDQVYGVYTFERDGQPVEALNLGFDQRLVNAGENTTDFSFYRFNASIGDAVQNQVPTWVGPAVAFYGGAFSFDGVDDVIVVIRNSNALDFGTDDFTMEGWIEPIPHPDGSVTRYSIIAKSSGGARYALAYNVLTQNLEFVISDGTNTAVLTSAQNSVPLDARSHFTVVVDRNDLATIYINGAASGNSNIATIGNIANTANLNIGKGADTNFIGTLDEIRFYKSVLSQGQITEHASGRYWVVSNEETNANEDWRCMVTPTDLTDVGDGNFSNSLTIAMRRANTPPTHTTPLLISETPRNRSIEDITCLNQTTADAENDKVVNIFNFIYDGKKYSVLNLPFEGHLDANRHAIEYSSGTRNADVNNAVFGATSGVIGGAYTFESASESYLNLSSTPDVIFETNENFTIEAWIKTDSPDGVVIGKQTKSIGFLSPGDSAYALRISGGYPRFEFTEGFNPAGMKVVTGSSRVDNGVYRYIAVVRDKGTSSIKMFVDGTQEATAPDTLTGPIGNNAADFVIGSLNKSVEFFDGVIDEVRAYSRALSEQEITSHNLLNHGVVKGSETTRGEAWTCEVTPSDGFDVGTKRTSSVLTIRNTEPMHEAPLLVSSSSLGLDSDNLTCANQNTWDADGDPVKNVYDFVIDDKLLAVLQLPFLPHEEMATKVIDYSKTANGTISGATYSTLSGRDSYLFDALDDSILFGNDYYNNSNAISIEAVIRLTDFKDNGTIVAKSGQNPRDVAFAFRTGDRNRPDELQMLYGLDGKIDIMTTTTANLFSNKWHHIVVRKPGVLGPRPEFFVDGAQMSSSCIVGRCTASLKTTKGGLSVGRDFQHNDNTVFSGYIDYVAVFNRSISNRLIVEHNLSRYEFMPEVETSPGQVWSCRITPNDGYVDGLMLQSEGVNITAVTYRPIRPPRGERISGTRLPNYTFDVRTQASAIYTLMPNYKVKILGVGHENIYLLVFDRGLITKGLFGAKDKKRAVLFLVPTIGTIDMEESSMVPLDLDRAGGNDISLRIVSVEEFSTKIELRRYGYEPASTLGGSGLPFGITPLPGGGYPSAPSSLTPISFRMPVIEEPKFAADRPRINYTAIGVIVLLIAIIAILIIMIRKLKL